MSEQALESIREYAGKMNEYLEAAYRPRACSDATIEKARGDFRKMFGTDLPEGYCTILRVADGLHHNGMTVWPILHRGFPFHQNLMTANEDFREFAEHLVFFGQLDDELYAYDTQKGEYIATEQGLIGEAWDTFDSAEEMILGMLKRAWGDD
ncbi:hypothetical protein HNP46_006069 [Pseudomonas nitritireducens]|uniref:SMI1/KNR4 family protein n=1 Tax=Pseudomonas nitroreducens TaxID=46680 RepID=A0A7W7P3N0_PSENT|nr:YrhA family protein [Pseudomonas nitritireducens]MBB4867158.1 hypothetical protein [Pseudomonas nitritireducens]